MLTRRTSAALVRPRRALGLALAVTVGACSAEPSGGTPPLVELTDTCTRGAVRCDGLSVQSCETSPSGGTKWSAPFACSPGSVCRGGACAEVTEQQRKHAASLASFVEQMSERSAAATVDWTSLRSRGEQAILAGDGTDDVFLLAMRRAFVSVPQGHQWLSAKKGCGQSVPMTLTSRFGVCGRPRGDEVIVTFARDGNRLGLRPGDRITRAGDDEGPALLEAANLRFMCSPSTPSESSRRTNAAASFFATVPAGMVLTVSDPSGAPRQITVPAEADQKLTSCSDPLGRPRNVAVRAELRPDGIGVITMPKFVPTNNKVMPTTIEEGLELVRKLEAEVAGELAKVRSAPALIWDVRSNEGGLTLAALAIVGGMPGAKRTKLSYCLGRVPGPPPATFDRALRGAEYEVNPAETGAPLAYQGRIAVLIDGLTYSAGDYFAYAVERSGARARLIGDATAGAFGASSGDFDVAGPPPLAISYDTNRCEDAVTGELLEGRGVPPHQVVAYDPDDLAAGIDTVLEAAVSAVR